MHVGLRLGIWEGEWGAWVSYLLARGRGDTTPTRTVHSWGLQTVSGFGQQHISLSRGGRWLRGVSESSGLPLGEAELGTAPGRVSGQGMHGEGASGSIDLQHQSHLLLKDLTPAEHSQVRNRIEVPRGIPMTFVLLCICFQGLFSVHQGCKLWQLPCEVGSNVKTEISGKWLLQTTLAPWYFRLFSTHPWK